MKKRAVFAAGCFWGVQKKFDSVVGVISTRVGYTGGKDGYTNPSYEDVCSGVTKHAESIEVVFDDSRVSYGGLLEVFIKMHDPTVDGEDGSQYRSAIFYIDDRQRDEALGFLKKSQRKYKIKIMTKVEPLKEFFVAEEYNQKYNEKHGVSGMVC